ncbi:MAG: hypothetical protein EBY62_09225, partial [Cellvibrionales bacterium]|nr:hypothetical protein [Cellvibrionales bacterium]
IHRLIQEFTNNIVEGATSSGDFFIVTLHQKFLNELTHKLEPHDYTCTCVDTSMHQDHCVARFEPM